ncbi:unnamed protein product [Schistosoma curassoni]|nr:unnamed protein product [Schistosoma curassoni]
MNSRINAKTKSSVPDTPITKSELTKKFTNRLDRSTSLKNNTNPFY